MDSTASQGCRGLRSTREMSHSLTSQVKLAIEKGNIEGGKIYATDSIRKKNEQLNMLKVNERLAPLRVCFSTC